MTKREEALHEYVRLALTSAEVASARSVSDFVDRVTAAVSRDSLAVFAVIGRRAASSATRTLGSMVGGAFQSAFDDIAKKLGGE